MEQFLYQAIILVAIISGLPLVISTLLGLGLAVIQTAVQVQEQSLSFILKLLSLGFIFFYLRTYFESELLRFFQSCFDSIQHLAR